MWNYCYIQCIKVNGRIINLADTIRLFEENWTLTIYGWLGTNPYGIGDYFDRNHVDYTEYSTPSDYLAFKNYVNENIDTRQTYIVSFLLEPSTIFGGAHTAAFYSLGGKLYAFNRHNNDVDICEYDSLDDLIGEYPSEKFVVGYSLGFRSRLLEDETNLAFLDQ